MNSFSVGDRVVPIVSENVSGKVMKQYDSEYTIVEIVGDTAVLMSNGLIWGTFYLSNLKRV